MVWWPQPHPRPSGKVLLSPLSYWWEVLALQLPWKWVFLNRGGVRLGVDRALILLPRRRAACGPRWFNTSEDNSLAFIDTYFMPSTGRSLLYSTGLLCIPSFSKYLLNASKITGTVDMAVNKREKSLKTLPSWGLHSNRWRGRQAKIYKDKHMIC